VNAGGVTSKVHVNTCAQVAVLLQPSVAVYVWVWVRRHPLDVTVPKALVIVGIPQLSVAVAVPGAGTPLVVQPRLEPDGQDVKTDGEVSSIVTVFVQVL
jgi:hypothetical protein